MFTAKPLNDHKQKALIEKLIQEIKIESIRISQMNNSSRDTNNLSDTELVLDIAQKYLNGDASLTELKTYMTNRDYDKGTFFFSSPTQKLLDRVCELNDDLVKRIITQINAEEAPKQRPNWGNNLTFTIRS